jgi:hypothetical protein
MDGDDGDQAGSAVGRPAEGLGRHHVPFRSDGTHVVATLPEQEARVIVRGEFVLGHHDVLPASGGWQIGGHNPRRGADGGDDGNV